MKGMDMILTSKMKNIIVAVVSLVVLAAPLALVSTAGAVDFSKGVCDGTSLTLDGNENCGSAAGNTDQLNDFLIDAVNIFSIIVGIIAVIMIVVGGLKYIMSGGDAGKVGSAKNTIIYAIVGLIIVAIAQFLVRFVMGKATSITG